MKTWPEKGAVNGREQGLPHACRLQRRVRCSDGLRRRGEHLPNHAAEPVQARSARLEYLEAQCSLGPAAIPHLRPEHHRGDFPLHFLDGGVGRAAAADDDDRSRTLCAVEADRHIEVVHREPDRRAILDELRVNDAGKRARQVYVAAGERQNGLLGRNLPYERRELEVQPAYRVSKFVDVGKAKYFWRERTRIINAGHDRMKSSVAKRRASGTMPV